MIWNELIDRCLLFTSASRDMLRELMKEAEEELCTRLEIYDSLYKIVPPAKLLGIGHTLGAQVDHNYTKVPDDYIKDNYVLCNGNPLKKITEADIYRGNLNVVSAGEPTGYAISGDFILFNTQPDSGHKIVLSYKSSIDRLTKMKVQTITGVDSGNNYIYLDTDLGSDLNGLVVMCGITSQFLGSGLPSTSSYLGMVGREQGNTTDVISIGYKSFSLL